MPLPPLLNADGQDVKVKMETVSTIFDFDADKSIVFISSENRNRLFNGELCPVSRLIFLEFSLNSGESKSSIQMLPIAIQKDE